MNKQATNWENYLQYMYMKMGPYLEYILKNYKSTIQ